MPKRARPTPAAGPSAKAGGAAGGEPTQARYAGADAAVQDAALQDAVAAIDAALRARGTPERAEQEKRYLKSTLTHYGVTVPAIRKVALAFLADGAGASLGRGELRSLAESLWDREVFDLRFAAAEILTARAEDLTVDDLGWLEPLLRRSRTWALIDGLAVEVAAPILRRDPEAAPGILARWARDEDFWIRRTALLTFLRDLRAGDDDAFARFTAIAEPMLEEREFFIRKAIGWCLRDYGKKRPDTLAAWLLPRAARASGVTVREAVKHLPAERREAVLTAHRGPRGDPRLRA